MIHVHTFDLRLEQRCPVRIGGGLKWNVPEEMDFFQSCHRQPFLPPLFSSQLEQLATAELQQKHGGKGMKL